MKLHFGVVDIPYAHNPKGTSTGDVAGYLENKYHVMENFFQYKQQSIAGSLEQAAQHALENLVIGGPVSSQPFAEGTSQIETQFKQFITSGEIERIGYPGVPTQAALDRRSSR